MRQVAFLRAFQATASLSTAAQAAQIGRRRHYHWMEQDPHYRAAFERVRLETFDVLLDEAVRRGFEGWLEPILYQGRICGYARRYSDRLLKCLLEIFNPEKYGRTPRGHR